MGNLCYLHLALPKISTKPSQTHIKKLLLQMGVACGSAVAAPVSRRAAKASPVPSSNRILTHEPTHKISKVFWSKSCQLRFVRQWEQTARGWKRERVRRGRQRWREQESRSSPRKTEPRSAGVINYLQLSSLPHSARQKSCQGKMKMGGREKGDEKTKGSKRGSRG